MFADPGTLLRDHDRREVIGHATFLTDYTGRYYAIQRQRQSDCRQQRIAPCSGRDNHVIGVILLTTPRFAHR
jgi:hypothetical protein